LIKKKIYSLSKFKYLIIFFLMAIFTDRSFGENYTEDFYYSSIIDSIILSVITIMVFYLAKIIKFFIRREILILDRMNGASLIP
jgi:hypothetical protein